MSPSEVPVSTLVNVAVVFENECINQLFRAFIPLPVGFLAERYSAALPRRQSPP